MNSVVLMGRLTRDPDVRYSQGQNQTCVARYTLAVNRNVKKTSGNQQTADFISCISFGKTAEFLEKYVGKGTKICTSGRIQTGSYTNKDGQKVYTTDVVVERAEFAESKAANMHNAPEGPADNPMNYPVDENGFMQIPDDVGDEELPFN